MMILKVTKKQSVTLSVYFLKYNLGVKAWILFFNETSILVFAKLAIFLSI